MKTSQDQALRQHLLYLLKDGGAHAKFEDVIDIPAETRGKKARDVPYTAWMLLEHMRIAQWDILGFSRDPKHTSPAWPEGYWPKTEAPPSSIAWKNSIESFNRDLKAMVNLVTNPKTDLFAKIPWGDGPTILREVLLVADHNAYHLGALVTLRRLLGAWKE
jgi:hypothetical protein